jgi:hypothetical protein
MLLDKPAVKVFEELRFRQVRLQREIEGFNCLHCREACRSDPRPRFILVTIRCLQCDKIVKIRERIRVLAEEAREKTQISELDVQGRTLPS